MHIVSGDAVHLCFTVLPLINNVVGERTQTESY